MTRQLRNTFALTLAILTLAAATAQRGDEILANLRKDDWKAAYALAQDVAKQPSAPARDKGLAAMAAIRAGDDKLAARLTDGGTKSAHGWQKLAHAAVVQLQNNVREAERLAKEALSEPEAVNDARAFLFGIYQSEGEFATAAPYGKAILEAEPKGYPFDELLPQLKGLVAVYPTIPQRPKVEPAEGMNVRIPLKQVRPYITVEAMANEKPLVLALDTGGSVHPSLSPTKAKELGIEALGTSAAFGFGGLETVEIGIIEKLQIGDVTIGKQPAAMIGMLDMLTKFMGIGGVLDTRWMLDYVSTVDFDRKTLTLSDVSVYKGKPGEVLTQTDGSKQIAVPFSLIGDAKIVLPVKLNDWETWALLDTGAPINMYSFEWMQETLKEEDYKIGPSLAGGVGTSAEKGKSIVSTKPLTLTVGGHKITIARPVGQDSLDKQVSHGLGFRMGALLGLELFKDAQQFTIDGPARMLYIVYKAPGASSVPTKAED
ncbi:MAG: aspartyl protease family protein [Fimbriimonadia bacterium]|jgi:hypothetical protein